MCAGDVLVRKRQQLWADRALEPCGPRAAADEDGPGQRDDLPGGGPDLTQLGARDGLREARGKSGAALATRPAVGPVRMPSRAHEREDGLRIRLCLLYTSRAHET